MFKAGALRFKFENTGPHGAVQIVPDKNVLHKHRPLLQGYDSTLPIGVQFCSLSEIFGSTGIRESRLSAMKATVLRADVVKGGLLVYFNDGTIALFDPAFLYANRKSDGNEIMPNEDPD